MAESGDEPKTVQSMFAYVPPRPSNTISAKVPVRQGPAISLSGLFFGVFKEMANCAKKWGADYFWGLGHLWMLP